MQPVFSLCIIFVAVSITSLLTVGSIAIIALGSSGVFTRSKSSATITTIASTVPNTTTTISGTASNTTTTVAGILSNTTTNVGTASNTTTIASTVSNITTTISGTVPNTTTTGAGILSNTTTTNVGVTSNTTTTISNTTTAFTTTITATTGISVSSLNDESIYPSGSYFTFLSSFTPASDNLKPIPSSQSVLNEIGGVDNSSMIIEAGRAQHLYIHLPNDKSNSSNRLMSIPTVKRNIDRASSTRLTIGSNVITGVAIHFGPMGSNDSVIIVPISNQNNISNQTLGGVLLYNLVDGSVIIRIEISIPTSLCPLSNSQPVGMCLSINYQAYTVVNNNQITSALLVDIQMACGDVCSLPSGLCSASCTTCDGQQIAGYDTPVTRRYEMGASVGSFRFDYETYTIKDRITVWNGGILIFDTGCVGASDTVQLNYSSTSSFIRVDVEPNCDCAIPTGCGTAWDFTVHCLNSTISSRRIANNNKIAKDNTDQLSLPNKNDIESRLYAKRNTF